MVDVHDAVTRSRNMAAIRCVNTKPELVLRRALHRAGFRYRLHRSELPGRPDIVLPKYSAVVFVHGCFFHGHECAGFRWPRARASFWRKKIIGNRERDRRVFDSLRADHWRIAVVWECATRGKGAQSPEHVAAVVGEWLRSDVPNIELPGRNVA